MENTFRIMLVDEEESIAEALNHLNGKLDDASIGWEPNIRTFNRLLAHRTYLETDLYLISGEGILASTGFPSDFFNTVSRTRVAIDRWKKTQRINPLILQYDLEMVSAFDEKGIRDLSAPDGIVRKYCFGTGSERTPRFYRELAYLLNDKQFREGIRSKDPHKLGEIQDRYHMILGFNPMMVKTYEPPYLF